MRLNVEVQYLMRWILLSRYRTLTPTENHKAFASYQAIGKSVGLSSSTVRKYCLQFIKKS